MKKRLIVTLGMSIAFSIAFSEETSRAMTLEQPAGMRQGVIQIGHW